MQRYGTSRGDLRELSQLLVQSKCQRANSISRRFPDVSASRCLHKSCDVCTTRRRCAQVVHFFVNACHSSDLRAHKWPPDLCPHTRECAVPRRCAQVVHPCSASRAAALCTSRTHPHKRPADGSRGDRPSLLVASATMPARSPQLRAQTAESGLALEGRPAFAELTSDWFDLAANHIWRQ